ncbi:MAG: ATP synthase subunit b 2 [Alphaproteobacteria bacterium]
MGRTHALMTGIAAIAVSALPMVAQAAEEGSGGLPQFDPTYMPSQAISALVIFGILYWLLKNKTLPMVEDVLRARRQRIDTDLEQAELSNAEATVVEDDYTKSVNDAHNRARSVADETQAEVNAEVARRQAELGKSLDAKLAAAEKEIAEAQEKAAEVVVDVAGEITADLTEKLAGLKVQKRSVTAAVKAVTSN